MNDKLNFKLRYLLLLIIPVMLGACRGKPFQKQPIHPIMNMDQQKRFDAQEKNDFFLDNRAMRQPVEGTVARGYLREDRALYDGRNQSGEYIDRIPYEMDKAFIYRGQDQYDVYCTPCHGGTGDGQGIIMTGGYGYVPAPTYHSDRLREVTDGYMYDVIANGIRNMPAYNTQIDVKDRWAIVAYVRALQLAYNADESVINEYGQSIDELMAAKEKQMQEEEAKKAQQQTGGEVSVERGKKLFTANACQTCHSIDGSRMTGPTHKGVFGRKEELQDGTVITADEEYLIESIVKPNAKVVKGYQAVMPAYTNLSESELQSLVLYMKSL